MVQDELSSVVLPSGSISAHMRGLMWAGQGSMGARTHLPHWLPHSAGARKASLPCCLPCLHPILPVGMLDTAHGAVLGALSQEHETIFPCPCAGGMLQGTGEFVGE